MTNPAESATRGFHVECEEREDTLIALCHGKLTFENSQAMKDALRDKIPGHKHILIDLREVPQVDSSGLGTVVGLYVSARTRGCRVEIVNASQQIRDLFSVTNLLSLFEPVGRHGRTL